PRALRDPRDPEGHRRLDIEGRRDAGDQCAHHPVPSSPVQRGAALGDGRRTQDRVRRGERGRGTVLEELVAVLGFRDDVRAWLRALPPRLAPEFGAIATRFYEAVVANPSAAAVLNGPASIDRLRALIIDWMSSGLLGPQDERYYEKRSRIGRRHVTV